MDVVLDGIYVVVVITIVASGDYKLYRCYYKEEETALGVNVDLGSMQEHSV